MGADPKTQLLFFDQIAPFIEILNGNPISEKNKADAEKVVADTNTLLSKTIENIKTLEASKLEKESAVKANAANVPEAKKFEAEVKVIEGKIKTEIETKAKLDDIIAKKVAELRKGE